MARINFDIGLSWSSQLWRGKLDLKLHFIMKQSFRNFFNVPNYQCWCLLIYQQNGLAEKVIYAINSGGEAHVDTYGIRYQRDPLRSVGTASDYGKQLLIGMRHSTLLKFSLRSNSYALLKRFWTINSYRKSSRRRPNSLSNGAIPYIYIWIWYTCLRRWVVSSRIEIQWSLLQCT